MRLRPVSSRTSPAFSSTLIPLAAADTAVTVEEWVDCFELDMGKPRKHEYRVLGAAVVEKALELAHAFLEAMRQLSSGDGRLIDGGKRTCERGPWGYWRWLRWVMFRREPRI